MTLASGRRPRAGCVLSRLQPGDRAQHAVFVHVVHIDGAADAAQQRDGELAAEVLAKIFQAAEHRELAAGTLLRQRVVPQREAQRFEQRDHRVALASREQTCSTL